MSTKNRNSYRQWPKYVIALLLIPFISLQLYAREPDGSYGFIENKGQVQSPHGDEVLFYLEKNGIQVFLLQDGLAYQFSKSHRPAGLLNSKTGFHELNTREVADSLDSNTFVETYRIDLRWKGITKATQIETQGKSRDWINFYNRNTIDVHHYQEVIYHNIYPGIDWKLYIGDQGFKYDFIVNPGADPSVIVGVFSEPISLDQEGTLRMNTKLGEVRESTPLSFQGENQINSSYSLSEGRILRFWVDEYDIAQPLIIDPSVIWATYYGSTGEEGTSGISVDGVGNVYLTGTCEFAPNLSYNGHQEFYGGSGYDTYLVKFNAEGNRLWATYYGGSGVDLAANCTTDNWGNVYICGATQSDNNIAYQGFNNTPSSQIQGYLVKFDSLGTRIWGTYYSGFQGDIGDACATDYQNNVYLCGATESTIGIAYNGEQNYHAGGLYDVFLVKFNTQGQRLWATYFGGENDEHANQLKIDTAGNILMSGYTNSETGIALNAHQSTFGGGNNDGYLVKFDSTGQKLWSTYYGGEHTDYGTKCAFDQNGNHYLYGATKSENGIAFNGYQMSFAGNSNWDCYLAKFNPDGNREWSTYYGNSEYEWPGGVNVDGLGKVWFVGASASISGIATQGAAQPYNFGESDGFYGCFYPDGTLEQCSYYGSFGEDGAYHSTIRNGSLHFCSLTTSESGITFNGFQNEYGGGDHDAFLVKMDICSTEEQIEESVCDSFYFNGVHLFSDGTYLDTLFNAQGCNHFVELNLSILTDQVNQNITHCGPYTWPANGQQYIASGQYETTLTNQHGCDSTITINLTINENSQSAIDTTVCDTYTAPDGLTYQQTGNYESILESSIGCDSTISIDLSVNFSSILDQEIVACESLDWNGQTLTASGEYQYQTVNQFGCDSTVNLSLTIGQPGYSTTEITACKLLEWNGQVYAETGLYHFNTITDLGCDSVADLDLTIIPELTWSNPTDTTVTIGEDAGFRTYVPTTYPSFQWQWLNGGDFEDILNAGQYYGVQTDSLSILQTTNANDGQTFRCILSSEVCEDTTNSAVLTIFDNTSVDENDIFLFNCYHNHHAQTLVINGNGNISDLNIEIHDTVGRSVYSKNVATFPIHVSTSDWASGSYLIRGSNRTGKHFTKLVLP